MIVTGHGAEALRPGWTCRRRSGNHPPMPRYRPQLNSLRAFAAFAILVSHFWISSSALAAPLGLLAVRLFFVLSGFLLTSILLAEREEAARRGAPMRRVLGNFYVRRILRIWPAYYFAIAAALLLGAGGMAATFGWHAVFASNILFFLQDSWHPEIASHLWTWGSRSNSTSSSLWSCCSSAARCFGRC